MSPREESSDTPRGGRFATTQWSLVLAAGDSQDPGFRAALAKLCEVYWYPAYAYVRRRGVDRDTAQDLTQGFFSELLEKKSLRVADPGRGRFRSFLLTSLKYYMANEWDRTQALKRGGGEKPLPLDFDTAETRLRHEPADERTPDKAFERRWALTVLERALQRLAEETRESQGAERYDRLVGFLTGDNPKLPYRKVAEELGMSEGAVKVAVHRMRKTFGTLLREEVGHTVDDPERVDEEIRFLFAAMES